MSDLISRSALIEAITKYKFGAISNDVEREYIKETVLRLISTTPTVEAVPLRNVYRLIAGHSDYHGDDILSALTCVTEGKEVKPIKPLEIVPCSKIQRAIDNIGIIARSTKNADFINGCTACLTEFYRTLESDYGQEIKSKIHFGQKLIPEHKVIISIKKKVE